MIAPLALFAFAVALPQGGQAGTPVKGVPMVPLKVQQAGLDSKNPKTVSIKLELKPDVMNMEFLKNNMMGFVPSRVMLISERPAGVQREPAYIGSPKYGAMRVGNGSKAVTYFVIDEAKDKGSRIYVDTNQNGDLTDDGDGAWGKTNVDQGVTWLESTLTVHASWGSALLEEEGGAYTFFAYRRQGDDQLNFTRTAARGGTLNLNGKAFNVFLAETTGDGIFTVPKARERTRGSVNLMVDLNADGKFTGFDQTLNGKKVYQGEIFALDRPFQLGGAWWDAFPNLSGSELTFVPSAAPGEAEPKQAPVEEKQLLRAGTMAPDFTAIGVNGKPIKLSSLRGKVVLLDFWATWCGPCQASMPGLQEIYNKVKSQGVVVFSVCVWDSKEPYDSWIEANAGKKYNFTFAFDQAGKDSSKSIAGKLYNVSGIPTMYIIDKTGKISTAIVGSGNEENLVKALGKLGIRG